MDLSDREFELLALIAFDEMSGRQVANEYKAQTGKSVSYGTLYTTFRRLKDQGFVTTRDDQDADGRIKFFSISPSGKAALRAMRQYHKRMVSFGLAGGAA